MLFIYAQEAAENAKTAADYAVYKCCTLMINLSLQAGPKRPLFACWWQRPQSPLSRASSAAVVIVA